MSGNKFIVEVEPRSDTGSSASRRLRRSGHVPGNVYGMELPAYAVTVNPRSIEEVLRSDSGRNTIFTLTTVGGDTKRDVMIRDLQRDPVNERVVHVDFVRVDPTKRIEIAVPVHLIGTAIGIKNEGGTLDFIHREIHAICLPGAIPEHFDVDVSGLHAGQHVSVKDVTIPPGVEILDDPETVLAVVNIIKIEEEPTEAEEGEEAAADAEATEGEAAGEEDEKKDD